MTSPRRNQEVSSPRDGAWMKFRIKFIPRSKRGLKNLRIFLNDGVHITHVPNAKKPLQPGLRGVFMWPHLAGNDSVKGDVARPITTQNHEAVARLAKRMIAIESATLERKATPMLCPQHNHSMLYKSIGPTITARNVGKRIEQELNDLTTHPELVPNGAQWRQLSSSCKEHLGGVRDFRRTVRVGIIDSGLSELVRRREFTQRNVAIRHFDENGNTAGENCFEDFDLRPETNGHGSSCSVILAGNTLGVDSNCHLSVAAIARDLTELAFASALQWLATTQAIEVLSLSFSTNEHLGIGDGQTVGIPCPDTTIRQCFENAVAGNLFAFAAVGNFNPTNGHTGGLCGSPADSQHAFAVGSLHVMGTKACETSLFSVVRESGDPLLKSVPEFIAAGENVETLDKMTRRPKMRIGGSASYACPQVAGVASLILSRFPERTLTSRDLTVLLDLLGVRFPVTVADYKNPNQVHKVTPIKLVSFR